MKHVFNSYPAVAGLALALLLLPLPSAGSDADSEVNSGYRLSVRDHVEVAIFDEPDLTVAQRIDGRGQVRLPLLGTIEIAGMSVRKAEDFIESLYVEKRLLRNPMATVRVVEYAVREVSVHGAVGSSGTLTFPPEVNSLDIIDVIAKSGGLLEIADGKNVRLTRMGPDGSENVIQINVEAMITGRNRGSERPLVYPGDVIFVPTRVW